MYSLHQHNTQQTSSILQKQTTKDTRQHIRSLFTREYTIRPMKLDYQFLAQIFENLMRAGGYYSLFIIFPKVQHTSKHEEFCQKTVTSTLITFALNS